MWEERRTPVQPQLVAKQFKLAVSRSRGQMGRICGKYGKAHEGVCRSGSRCHKRGKESHIASECR